MNRLEIDETFPPITRAALAIYAGASGDLNLVHIDSDAARNSGFDDVFAQGMLVMAYMGRAVTESVPLDRLRSFRSRFMAITHLGDVLRCSGTSGEPFDEAGEQRIAIELKITDQRGEVKITGRAIFAP
jgi:acyl dehydratase